MSKKYISSIEMIAMEYGLDTSKKLTDFKAVKFKPKRFKTKLKVSKELAKSKM